MPNPRAYTPCNPARLSNALVVWLYVEMGLVVMIGLISVIKVLILLRVDPARVARWGQPTPETQFLEPALLVIGLGWAVAYLIAGFMSLKWIYRISRNAHSMTDSLTMRPPCTVAWFFVPIMSLWKPFQGLREAWQASVAPETLRSVETPVLLRWWWGLWLASNFMAPVSANVGLRVDTMSDLIMAEAVTIAAAALSVLLSLVFIRVVRRLAALQLAALSSQTFD